MYRDFYGLRRNAFEISPDPSFFFPTAPHNEALANLVYGIQKRKGFVVMTGEAGTGKTLLLRCLLDLLENLRIASVYIFNPRLSSMELLQFLLHDLRIPEQTGSKAQLLRELEAYLAARQRTGSTAVLIVDEGQLLSADLLEELRLLGNLESSEGKLLQIVLAGQLELDAKLDSPNLGHLQQRIAFRCRLQPLTKEETEAIHWAPPAASRRFARRNVPGPGRGSNLQVFAGHSAAGQHSLRELPDLCCRHEAGLHNPGSRAGGSRRFSSLAAAGGNETAGKSRNSSSSALGSGGALPGPSISRSGR